MLNTGILSRDQVLHQFLEIQQQQQAREAQMSTKAEVAQRDQQDAVVQQARVYTVEGIVQGLAALQLNFGSELDRISDTLGAEANKLDELRAAITIEEARIKELEAIRISAEALALLTQAHERERARWAERTAALKAEITDEATAERAAWAVEQTEHDEAAAEYQERRDKARKAEEEASVYQIAKERARQSDAHEQTKTELERKLEQTAATKEEDWEAREETLTAAADEIKELLERDAAFPEELKAAKEKSRTAAIRKINEESKVAALLAEREMESRLKVFEAQSETLADQIESQAVQITSLLSQLEVAATQSQELAVKAIDTSARPASAA